MLKAFLRIRSQAKARGTLNPANPLRKTQAVTAI
jgi:hypothetical protein